MREDIYVIDASGFITGYKFSKSAMITVPRVVDEVIDMTSRLRLELLLESGLRVEKPLSKSLEQVRSAAISTGDVSVLSDTDVDLLAKALELNGEHHVILITDDYAIQNVAARLNIEFRPTVSTGIKNEVTWVKKCTGCGRIVRSEDQCPICGSSVRRHRIRQ